MMHGRHDCTDFSRDYAESFESESDERTRRTVLEFSHRQSHALHMYMRSSHFDLATAFFFFRPPDDHIKVCRNCSKILIITMIPF